MTDRSSAISVVRPAPHRGAGGCGEPPRKSSHRAITEPLHPWHAARSAAARASGWLSPFPCAAAQGSGAAQDDMANLYVIALSDAARVHG